MKLPPLNALPAFEATVRLGSMTAAAEELGRTHGAVSKQIMHLSEQAGVPLFRKVGAGVTPTSDGKLLAEAARSALGDLERAWTDLKQRSQAPVLDIAVSATFAMRWLMPLMPRFYQRRPDAQVNFRMTGKTRIPDDEIDVILTWDRLRRGFHDDDDIQVLGDVAFGIVHAPGLEMDIQGKHLKVRNRCVQQLPGDVWGAYSRLTEITVQAESKTAYEHTFLVIEAALAGFGAALLEKRLVEDELKDGRLIAPFGFQTIEGGFGAILPDGKQPRPLVKVFLDWLQEEAKGYQP
ncbi:LysR substrate-binding domain-containing protein [uncultured Roseibium sp.]|uniref:LysR substrate-binding domain-containing protein n=1 Tax=uncultured Roseibium sp. TaxID=1936171 RepID=UPI002604AF8D|nr:LysR substrate-binding domain-containing protein [uncultured Roseibium sp.]